MVDLDRIHQRLELLAGYLRELRRLRDLPAAEYLKHEVYAGRYLVQVAAQTCIDLTNHVIASPGCEIGLCTSMTRSTTPGCRRRSLPDCPTWTRSPPPWPGS